jgi:hypothetical protein
LIVQDDTIVFGSTLKLLCTLDDSLNLTNDSSRLWFGGSENTILSFDGFLIDPNKYKEDVISTRQFLLKIFNTSETDVNCYYKYVYGFKFDEKMLDLNKMKYLCKYKLSSFRLSNLMHRIGGVMISVFVLSVADRGFEPRSGQPKTMQLICVASLLSTQH